MLSNKIYAVVKVQIWIDGNSHLPNIFATCFCFLALQCFKTQKKHKDIDLYNTLCQRYRIVFCKTSSFTHRDTWSKNAGCTRHKLLAVLGTTVQSYHTIKNPSILFLKKSLPIYGNFYLYSK